MNVTAITSKHPYRGQKVHTLIETITPMMASQYLEQSKENRPIRAHHVLLLAKEMKEGRWVLNGEAIVFDYKGKLLDGQHRLWAAFEHAQSFETVVVRGVSPEAFSTIDSGLKRSAKDVLTKAGVSYGTLSGAAIRLVHFYKTGAKDHLIVQRMSNAETLQLFERYPRVEEAAKLVATTVGLAKIASPTALAAMAYFALDDDKDAANSFFDALASGENLKRTDPRLTARNFFLNMKGSHRRVHHRDQFALLIKAWNAFREERAMSVLKYVDSEQFPKIHHTKRVKRVK